MRSKNVHRLQRAPAAIGAGLALAAAVAVVSPAAGAPALAARAFRNGRDAGLTAQHLPIAFTVHSRYVGKIRFDIYARCTDGFEEPIAVHVPGRDPYDKAHPGRFELGGGPAAYAFVVVGNLHGSRAKGYVKILDATVNGKHQLDPAGSIHCRTHNVHWNARVGRHVRWS